MDWISRNFNDEMYIIFVQIQAGADAFKFFATTRHEGEINYAPGTGLIIDLEQVALYFEWLSDFIIDKRLRSPMSYLVYASGQGGNGEMRIWMPSKENSTKVFLSHMDEERRLASPDHASDARASRLI